MKKTYDTEGEASLAVTKNMDSVVNHGGRWMIAVWQVEEDGTVTIVDRSTWRFPIAAFLPAVAQLTNLCAYDTGHNPASHKSVLPEIPPPLKMANLSDNEKGIEPEDVDLHRLSATVDEKKEGQESVMDNTSVNEVPKDEAAIDEVLANDT